MNISNFDKYNTLRQRKEVCEKRLKATHATEPERAIIRDVLVGIENTLAELEALMEI